jgi:hypothetical protein
MLTSIVRDAKQGPGDDVETKHSADHIGENTAITSLIRNPMGCAATEAGKGDVVQLPNWEVNRQDSDGAKEGKI